MLNALFGNLIYNSIQRSGISLVSGAAINLLPEGHKGLQIISIIKDKEHPSQSILYERGMRVEIHIFASSDII